MKNIVRTMIIALLLVAAAAAAAFAVSIEDATIEADNLHALGLFEGTGTNPDGTPVYSLERPMTREQAITMLVRLLGKETEALYMNYEHPFTDVAEWASPYVGYAYQNKLTDGTSATTFSGKNTVTAAQYITFVLRAMEYKDEEDFKWKESWVKARRIGIFEYGEYDYTNNNDFKRADAVHVSYGALSAYKRLGGTIHDDINARKEAKSELTALVCYEGHIKTEVGEKVKPEVFVYTNGTNSRLVYEAGNSNAAVSEDGTITAKAAGTGIIYVHCLTAEENTPLTIELRIEVLEKGKLNEYNPEAPNKMYVYPESVQKEMNEKILAAGNAERIRFHKDPMEFNQKVFDYMISAMKEVNTDDESWYYFLKAKKPEFVKIDKYYSYATDMHNKLAILSDPNFCACSLYTFPANAFADEITTEEMTAKLISIYQNKKSNWWSVIFGHDFEHPEYFSDNSPESTKRAAKSDTYIAVHTFAEKDGVAYCLKFFYYGK